MIIDLWSIPVYKENTDHTWSRFSDEQKNKLLALQEDRKEKHNTVIKYKGILLDDPLFKDIRELITTHALIYKNEIMMCENELELQSSWFTVNRKGQSHDFHKHRHTIFSVCYYPKVNSGDLVLETPEGKNSFMKDYCFGFKYSNFNRYNCSMWTIPLIAGDIVIFPGYISHGSTENDSDTDRYMIGANFWLKGEMVFFDELDRINV